MFHLPSAIHLGTLISYSTPFRPISLPSFRVPWGDRGMIVSLDNNTSLKRWMIDIVESFQRIEEI